MLSAGLTTAILLSDTKDAAPTIISETELDSDLKKHRSYSDKKDLYGIEESGVYQQKYTDRVFGGVVSHHLLANLDIAEFFAELSDQEISRIIVIGPNHFEPISYPALSTLAGYQTPFGKVDVDTDYVNVLISAGLVQEDFEVIDSEHAISTLTPYIAHYLPNAKLVPVILTRSASIEHIDNLTEFLVRNSKSNTVVIASVDFSHHLYSNAAYLHDLKSVAALRNLDLENLLELEVDSPQSLHVWANYMSQVGARDVSTKQQSAANIFANYDMEDVTSYVFAHARSGERKVSAGATALFFGDLSLGRGIEGLIDKGKDIFAGIRGPEGNFLRGYDAIVANLEGAIETEDCTFNQDELLIKENNLSLLVTEGFTHVGTVNNHYQRCATDDTQEFTLLKNNLIPLTENEAVTISGTNNEIHIISLYAAPVPNDTSEIIEQVRKLSTEYENLIVNIHWGVEHSQQPTAQQTKLAHDLIDVGVDVVVGHHPHVVQPIELYGGGVILYSLGNFLFDQVGELNRNGLASGVFFGDKTLEVILFPFEQISGIPTHITQEEAREICENLVENKNNNDRQKHPCIVKVR